MQNTTDQSDNIKYGVSFVDNLNGWVVGIARIIHTTNGGLSWAEQTSGTQTALNGVYFKDKNTGWITGGHIYSDRCVILKTTNGGSNWSKQIIDDTSCIPKSIFVTKANIGWAVGEGVIYGTILATRFPYDTTGISGSDETTVTDGYVRIKASEKPSICDGDSIELTCYPVGEAYSHIWSTGETSQTITVKANGTYQVLVKNTAGIKDSISMKVTVNPRPVVHILPGNVITMCSGDKITLTADGNYPYYYWSTGDFDKQITISDSGHYELTVQDTTGCSRTFGVDVAMKDLMLGITPTKRDCGKVPINKVDLFTINLSNEGTEDIVVDSIYVVSGNSAFSPDNKETYPLTVNAGNSHPAKIVFSPKKELKMYIDSILIQIGEPCQRRFKVDVTGIGDYANGVNDLSTNSISNGIEMEIYSILGSETKDIYYSLQTSGVVRISVYNTLGTEISVLTNEYREAGSYRISYYGENLTYGIYFLTLRNGKCSETRKFLITR